MNDLLNTLHSIGIPVIEAAVVNGCNDLDLVQVIVPGSEAENTWRILRDGVAQTQRWPVVIGGRNELENLRERADRFREESGTLPQQVQQWIQKAEELPFETWLENQRNPQWKAADYLRQAQQIEGFPDSDGLVKLYRQIAEDYRQRQPEVFDPSTCDWPEEEVPAVTNLQVLMDMETLEFVHVDGKVVPRGPELVKEAVIILLPTATGWEAPAYLFFGGFNACPLPDIHVAMAKWGWLQHTASVVSVSCDSIELQCRSAPVSRDDALRLALALRVYAEEVTVVANTLGTLASALKNGSIWSCWWD